MLNKKTISCIGLLLSLIFISSSSDAQFDDGLGQTVKIYTRLHSFTGKPSWLLIIRDVDHNQNIPYVYDIRRGNNFWFAFTFGRNYLISVSNMQFSPYKRDPFRSKRTNNFCNIESNGRIIHGKSMTIMITGELSPNSNTYTCHVSTYPGGYFTVVPNGEQK